MKYLKLSIVFLLGTILMVSCKKDDEVIPEKFNLKLVKSFTESGNTVEVFNNTGEFKVGYNKVFIRLTDKDGKYVTQSSIDWMPMMTMKMGEMMHQHTCPFSQVSKVKDKDLFEGYIVYSMATNGPDNFWNLKINFTVEDQSFEVDDTVEVGLSDSEYNKVFITGMGSDTKMYLMALIEPTTPKIGTNDIVVGLFKKEENSFPMVNNFKIKVDPRMPGMGNHSAPANEDMIQGADGFYHGKVGFSMSGYWKINLILEDSLGNVIKGEPITEEKPESSIFFKLEF